MISKTSLPKEIRDEIKRLEDIVSIATRMATNYVSDEMKEYEADGSTYTANEAYNNWTEVFEQYLEENFLS